MDKFVVAADMARPLEFIRMSKLMVMLLLLALISSLVILRIPIWMSATNDSRSPNPSVEIHTPSTSSTTTQAPIGDASSSTSTPEGSDVKTYLNPIRVHVKCNEALEVTNLQLVMTWPAGFCTTPEKCWEEVDFTRFYIHGLWPADANGRNKCACRLIFDPIYYDLQMQLLGEEIIEQLYEHWPSYAKTTRSPTQYIDSPKFWKHEYLRHGSCADMVLSEYFRRVLDKGGNLKLENWLAEMLQDTTRTRYTKEDFRAALSPYIGSNEFYLGCLPGNRLKEIFLCLDAHATEFISCPPTAKKLGCTEGQEVTFHKSKTF